jgi:hypothetical protein
VILALKEEEFFFKIALVDFKGQNVMKAYQSDKNIDRRFIKKMRPMFFMESKK